ncbi:MerR family transcriptional regulator [Streptomyces sp. NPDC006879]|uniref:MerR family transcriptional regulator n=1 Tax=Streptomyces sp. NPDC006879 TaxID=3364767 RepID=UPI003699C992
MSYSVGQVAGFAKVTVRTLHHYDEIGLLSPSGRSRAGHRRYAEADLDRLQQILFYRALGFPLDQVAALLDDPRSDPQEHLRRQHALLSDRIARLQEMAAAVEHAMEARGMGIELSPEERFEVFGDHDPEQYAAEAEGRWGDTEAYRESTRRAASYSGEDWKRIMAEAEGINQRLAALMERGATADETAAMDLAEEHRGWIGEHHYACGYEMHRGLGEMYVQDPRFTAVYERIRPGLAMFLRDAIFANAARHDQ